MGKEKTVVQSSGSSQATPTAEETELNRLQLEQAKAFDPIQRQLNESGGNLVNKLLLGQPLPGYLSGLPGGISEEVTGQLVQKSIADLQPTFQNSGLIDSGVNASISARTAGDIRLNSAQFNLQNLQQLLNLAVGGQAQVQQPQISQGAILSQRLAGLRNNSFSGSNTTLGMNPFLKSFQTSLGNNIGGFGYSQANGLSFGG